MPWRGGFKNGEFIEMITEHAQRAEQAKAQELEERELEEQGEARPT